MWEKTNLKYFLFNNDVTVSPLITNSNSSTAQEIVNWVTTSQRRHDSTRLLSRVGVGGVYCA